MLRKNFTLFRNLIFQNYREKVLSEVISNEITYLNLIKKNKTVKILDYGSGYNPILIKEVIKKLSVKYKKTKFIAFCYDYYNKKELKLMNKSKKVRFFNIKKLSIPKMNSFDFCLLSDVLHHIGLENENKIVHLIKKLKNKAKIIIIKDHFQYGYFSNLALKIMDFIGNYGDKVKIPKIYFRETCHQDNSSIKCYDNLIKKLKMKERKRITDKTYYKWYWLYFNSKKLQFISILE